MKAVGEAKVKLLEAIYILRKHYDYCDIEREFKHTVNESKTNNKLNNSSPVLTTKQQN